MKILNISVIAIIVCAVSGCKSKAYVGFAVGNKLGRDTVRVECVYKKSLLPPDSTVRYVYEWLPPQLQLLPDFENDKKKGIPTKFIKSASVAFPEYNYEILFKGNTVMYVLPPQRQGYVSIRHKGAEYISGLIDRITITAGGGTVSYSTQETIKELLKKSEQKEGNILIQVDSAMFNIHQDL